MDAAHVTERQSQQCLLTHGVGAPVHVPPQPLHQHILPPAAALFKQTHTRVARIPLDGRPHRPGAARGVQMCRQSSHGRPLQQPPRPHASVAPHERPAAMPVRSSIQLAQHAPPHHELAPRRPARAQVGLLPLPCDRCTLLPLGSCVTPEEPGPALQCHAPVHERDHLMLAMKLDV